MVIILARIIHLPRKQRAGLWMFADVPRKLSLGLLSHNIKQSSVEASHMFRLSSLELRRHLRPALSKMRRRPTQDRFALSALPRLKVNFNALPFPLYRNQRTLPSIEASD